MPGKADYIFFYGTLMRTFPLRARVGIDDWLEYVGDGRVPGLLFDLGSYPGLVADVRSEVCGEVYRILNAAKLFNRIDPIEDYRVMAPHDGQYIRQAMNATLDDGRAKTVWCYVYNQPLPLSGRIEGGDYRHYVKS
jgi:gamma-glutamylcyclotransferase (GGCT)/AIG2-like uncharacterized protein YtfP